MLGVDDPFGHRLDTWGVGVGIHMAYFILTLCVIRALDDLVKTFMREALAMAFIMAMYH
jgi:hypothetical protein